MKLLNNNFHSVTYM